MNNNIIVVKQLPVIEQQLQQIKTSVTAKVDTALNLVCTEDTVKDVKKVRAALNAELKEWESKRKEVKNAVLSPYEQFEKVYKECISEVFKNADTQLKAKINSVENELKEQKNSDVKAYFEEYKQSKGLIIAYGDFINFEQAHINVTLSASMKSLKEQVTTYIDKICDDLNLIETQDHKDEILYEYKNTLNVSGAITTVAERYKAIEAAKAAEEERKQREQEEAATVKKVDEATAPLAAPKPVEQFKPVPVSKYTFTVIASEKKLKILKDFLESEEFDYECIQ